MWFTFDECYGETQHGDCKQTMHVTIRGERILTGRCDCDCHVPELRPSQEPPVA